MKIDILRMLYIGQFAVVPCLEMPQFFTKNSFSESMADLADEQNVDINEESALIESLPEHVHAKDVAAVIDDDGLCIFLSFEHINCIKV